MGAGQGKIVADSWVLVLWYMAGGTFALWFSHNVQTERYSAEV